MTGKTMIALAGLLAVVACDNGSTGPGETTGEQGVRFGEGQHTAVGNPTQQNGSILHGEFAVARADSLDGIVVVSYKPQGGGYGNLFVLQAPRRTGTYVCGNTNEPCHGVYFTYIKNSPSSTTGLIAAGDTTGTPPPGDTLRFYNVTAGTLQIAQVGPDRLKGTFSITLTEIAGRDGPIVVTNGTIDVPYSNTLLTAATMSCLMRVIANGGTGCTL